MIICRGPPHLLGSCVSNNFLSCCCHAAVIVPAYIGVSVAIIDFAVPHVSHGGSHVIDDFPDVDGLPAFGVVSMLLLLVFLILLAFCCFWLLQIRAHRTL